MSEQHTPDDRLAKRRRRHEITTAEVQAILDQPLVNMIATAHGPSGSKTIEFAVDLKTHAIAFIVKSKETSTIYVQMSDAVDAYNEAPGP